MNHYKISFFPIFNQTTTLEQVWEQGEIISFFPIFNQTTTENPCKENRLIFRCGLVSKRFDYQYVKELKQLNPTFS
jgi:hypothetical protein